MKYYYTLIITLFSLFLGTGLLADENPFMKMAGQKYADYAIELFKKYYHFIELDSVEAQNTIRQIEEVAKKTGNLEWILKPYARRGYN